jgi:glycosyltransferase involved in cell wall biosynthesis
VELITSRFAHGPVPPAEGYEVSEAFYRRSAGRVDARGRRSVKAIEHVGDMLRFRRGASADLVHYQWLTFPALDRMLLPTTRPRVLTPHGWLRREAAGARGYRGFRRLLEKMDAVVSLSEYGATHLRDEAEIAAERIHVIPHGAFDYLTRLPDEAPLPEALAQVDGPVILFFGLIRPYKGLDVLLEAFHHAHGELWVVGRALGMSLDPLRRDAARAPGVVRFVERFVEEREMPAYFRRADVVVLPYRDAEQSGVLYTALAFGKAIVLTDVGGFSEVAALGAAELVPPEEPEALGAAVSRILLDVQHRKRLEAGARAAADGPYSWDTVGAQTVDLYTRLLGGAAT